MTVVQKTATIVGPNWMSKECMLIIWSLLFEISNHRIHCVKNLSFRSVTRNVFSQCQLLLCANGDSVNNGWKGVKVIFPLFSDDRKKNTFNNSCKLIFMYISSALYRKIESENLATESKYKKFYLIGSKVLAGKKDFELYALSGNWNTISFALRQGALPLRPPLIPI